MKKSKKVKMEYRFDTQNGYKEAVEYLKSIGKFGFEGHFFKPKVISIANAIYYNRGEAMLKQAKGTNEITEKLKIPKNIIDSKSEDITNYAIDVLNLLSEKTISEIEDITYAVNDIAKYNAKY